MRTVGTRTQRPDLMPIIAVENISQHTLVAARVMLADRWWLRLRGLLGRRLMPDEGLLITPCRAIHTFGMRYPLDVAFLGRDDVVVAVITALQPNRLTGVRRNAASVLELPAGTLLRAATAVGDQLRITTLRG